MYYIYILLSTLDGSFYIGYTSDVSRRFNAHNLGRSIATKHKRPWKLIHVEGFLNRIDAKNREKYLKSGWGRKSIKIMLKEYLTKLNIN